MPVSEAVITELYAALKDHLDERQRRLFVGAASAVMGKGGDYAVQRATGVSRPTIARGRGELAAPVALDPGRVRKPGAGRTPREKEDPVLVEELEKLVEPVTRGDPESNLRWTLHSTRVLASELTGSGHAVSHVKVGQLLKGIGYSLQGNQKTLEGGSHPDRNAQFEYINAQSEAFQRRGQPVISVDTKKKELVGEFKNGGKEYRQAGDPEKVKVHDFVTELGRAIPYGVLDVAANEAWVSVGMDHDTSAFAVESIRRWWLTMGKARYPKAKDLLITCDGGGSNGSRARLWKVELQKLADDLQVTITVSHFPPGTSKWNKIEHRLFSFITLNWRGKPLVSHEAIVNLIGATRTTKGLKVKAGLDEGRYPTKVKVPNAAMEALRLKQHAFHGDWNYTLRPARGLTKNKATISKS